MYKCKFFNITELVSQQVFYRYGEFAWGFFTSEFKEDLDTIREKYNKPLIVNNWNFKHKGTLQQCGFRSNLEGEVLKRTKNGKLYCSAHCMGKAVDLHSDNNEELFNLCKNLIESKQLKTMKRLESSQSTRGAWVHIDSFDTPDGSLQIFTA